MLWYIVTECAILYISVYRKKMNISSPMVVLLRRSLCDNTKKHYTTGNLPTTKNNVKRPCREAINPRQKSTRFVHFDIDRKIFAAMLHIAQFFKE